MAKKEEAKKNADKKAKEFASSDSEKKAEREEGAKNKNSSQPSKSVIDEQEKKEEKGVLEMNLAEGQIINYFDWRKGAFIVLSMIILVVMILSGIYWGLSMWGEYRAEKNEFFAEQSAEMKEDIQHLRENAESAFIYKEKLELADQLLDDHIYWTNFFELLEERTFGDVYYVGFQGDVIGEYTISTQARDLSMINSQVQHLQDSDFIKDVKVRSVTSPNKGAESEGSEGMAFDLELEIDPELFTASN